MLQKKQISPLKTAKLHLKKYKYSFFNDLFMNFKF
jgi:hypothetical protein